MLVAEDEFLVAMLLEDILTDNGCIVSGPFGNLHDALAAADTATVDVALLDVNLSGEKIYPVAERLSERGIPFFLLTGYGQDAVPLEHPEWQACAKPFKAEDLIAMIANRVGRG